MAKPGADFQNAVADVVKHIDTEADVQRQWISGPDGERDCDVAVYATSPAGAVSSYGMQRSEARSKADRVQIRDFKDFRQSSSIHLYKPLGSRSKQGGNRAA